MEAPLQHISHHRSASETARPQVDVPTNDADGPCAISAIVQGLSSSVRYRGASATALLMEAFSSSLVSLGAGAVRLATGTPTSIKNSSCPAGEHRQRRRAALPDLFLKECGAFDGIFKLAPAATSSVSPRKVNSISPSSSVNISSKSCRCGGGPPPSGTSISIRQ